MTNDLFFFVIPIVIFCSFIQSLFGVGLLVFGTPLLLLLGIPFLQALMYLLPCSLVLSILQVFEGRRVGEKIPPETRRFFLISLPLLFVGLLFVLLEEHSYNARVPIGLLLLFNALSRINSFLNMWLQKGVKKYRNVYLGIMGFIHGLTNMGGGLLTIFASTLYTGKEKIRFAIAGAYFFFAFSQLIPLLIFKSEIIEARMLILPILTIAVYYSIGRRVFTRSSEPVYQHMMTFFILLFGVSLIFF